MQNTRDEFRQSRTVELYAVGMAEEKHPMAAAKVSMTWSDCGVNWLEFHKEDGTLFLELPLDEGTYFIQGINPRTVIVNREIILKVDQQLRSSLI